MTEDSKHTWPLVSIITINFNQNLVTSQLIKSLQEASYPNMQIIVVDNASKEPPTPLRKLYPHIELIESRKNLGFAGGNNLGLEQARGEYILFINNDVEVEPGFLEPLVMHCYQHINTGMVCPKIRYYYHPETIQFAGYTQLNKITLRNNLIGYRQKDIGQYNKQSITPFGHGAAMMVPRTVIEKTGPMAECYFLYYEEFDWATRIKEKGYKIWYQPKSTVYHKESISTGKASPLKTYYLARNRLLYLRRNAQGYNYFLSLMYLVLLAAPKNLLTTLAKFRFRLFKAYLKGVTWHLTHPTKKHLQTWNG